MSELIESFLLEAEIIFNDKSFFPNNTDMFIKAIWRLSTTSLEGHIKINPVCEKVFGTTTRITNSSFLKKTIKLEFETDNSWAYETIKRNDTSSFDIFPDKAILNFDKKHVKIFF